MSGSTVQQPGVAPLQVHLPAAPAALVQVRRALRQWLARAGVADEVADALQVAVGEACANAVDHAHPPGRTGAMEVTVTADGDEVTARVADDGSWRTPDRDPGDRGRGLLIMQQLLESVDVRRGPEGTTVVLRARARALPARVTAGHAEAGIGSIDRTGAVPRLRLPGPLEDDAASGVRLALLEASRGGVLATELDLSGLTRLPPAVAAVAAELAAIGRANGWRLRVLATGQPVEALRAVGVDTDA